MTFVEADEELTAAIRHAAERERIDLIDAKKIADELSLKFGLSQYHVIEALGNLCFSRLLLPAECS